MLSFLGFESLATTANMSSLVSLGPSSHMAQVGQKVTPVLKQIEQSPSRLCEPASRLH